MLGGVDGHAARRGSRTRLRVNASTWYDDTWINLRGTRHWFAANHDEGPPWVQVPVLLPCKWCRTSVSSLLIVIIILCSSRLWIFHIQKSLNTVKLN